MSFHIVKSSLEEVAILKQEGIEQTEVDLGDGFAAVVDHPVHGMIATHMPAMGQAYYIKLGAS